MHLFEEDKWKDQTLHYLICMVVWIYAKSTKRLNEELDYVHAGHSVRFNFFFSPLNFRSTSLEYCGTIVSATNFFFVERKFGLDSELFYSSSSSRYFYLYMYANVL